MRTTILKPLYDIKFKKSINVYYIINKKSVYTDKYFKALFIMQIVKLLIVKCIYVLIIF